MGEPSSRIVAGDRRNGQMHGLLEDVLRPRPESPQDRLELGEGLLNGREVRRIGGRKSRSHCRWVRASRMLAALWALRWSRITT